MKESVTGGPAGLGKVTDGTRNVILRFVFTGSSEGGEGSVLILGEFAGVGAADEEGITGEVDGDRNLVVSFLNRPAPNADPERSRCAPEGNSEVDVEGTGGRSLSFDIRAIPEVELVLGNKFGEDEVDILYRRTQRQS